MGDYMQMFLCHRYCRNSKFISYTCMWGYISFFYVTATVRKSLKYTNKMYFEALKTLTKLTYGKKSKQLGNSTWQCHHSWAIYLLSSNRGGPQALCPKCSLENLNSMLMKCRNDWIVEYRHWASHRYKRLCWKALFPNIFFLVLSLLQQLSVHCCKGFGMLPSSQRTSSGFWIHQCSCWSLRVHDKFETSKIHVLYVFTVHDMWLCIYQYRSRHLLALCHLS